MAKPIICSHCNGEMQLYTGPRFNRKVAGFLILAGILATLFWIGAVLGIPLLIIGIYMSTAKRDLWVCKDCNVGIERIELNPKTIAKE
ncbi:MAG: hypothetical protein HQL22_06360 [Candidatus Omnitrophica bacterium]|nr:hypothetical protein [Candidatus Omnitrophota bacterium]